MGDKVLVTGAAGFIGFHTAKKLLEMGCAVVGFDNINDYYDVNIKKARIKILEKTAVEKESSFIFVHANLANADVVSACFNEHGFDRVIHLAAQAGVRYSIENPMAYVESNLVGFTNVLEGCRHTNIKHLTYASTSSVYGANTKLPFSEHDSVDHPLQFYAATKRANELMAHSYSHLFRLPTTGLRFFTVYGPWGRPDMALFKFTKNIINRVPIQVFNNGNHSRDFTYIDDIVEGVIRSSNHIAEASQTWSSENPDPATSNCPFRIYNIGNSNPIKLIDYISAIENELGIKAEIEMLPLQPGDVPESFADATELYRATSYKPTTNVAVGVSNFVKWYRDYYEQ